jgi:hypothetical protein
MKKSKAQKKVKKAMKNKRNKPSIKNIIDHKIARGRLFKQLKD